MDGRRQYPDLHDGAVPLNPGESKLSHGERRGRTLLLFYGFVSAITLGFALAEASSANRKLILTVYAIAGGALFLMARYIVYSYKREKGRVNPYDRDHIVK